MDANQVKSVVLHGNMTSDNLWSYARALETLVAQALGMESKSKRSPGSPEKIVAIPNSLQLSPAKNSPKQQLVTTTTSVVSVVMAYGHECGCGHECGKCEKFNHYTRVCLSKQQEENTTNHQATKVTKVVQEVTRKSKKSVNNIDVAVGGMISQRMMDMSMP